MFNTTCDLSFEQPTALGGWPRERLEDAAAGGLQLRVPSGCRAQGAASERKCDGRRCSQHARCAGDGGELRGLNLAAGLSGHHYVAGSLSGMGESMPRNVHSSHMKQAFATRQKTSQKRAKLRRMKELYASHLGSGGSASALGAGDSDGNKSASEDELLQVRSVSLLN